MARNAALVLGFLAVGFLVAQAHEGDKVQPKEKQKMTITGKLQHPVFAIGGETTGTVVETKKEAYELDLGKNKELLKLVESLKGKQVTVVGTLRVIKGVEIPERRIVTVSEIKEAKDAK